MTIAVSRMDVSGRLVKYDLRRFFFFFATDSPSDRVQFSCYATDRFRAYTEKDVLTSVGNGWKGEETLIDDAF